MCNENTGSRGIAGASKVSDCDGAGFRPGSCGDWGTFSRAPDDRDPLDGAVPCGWVLSIGGRHGTPATQTEKITLRIRKVRNR